MDKVFAAIVQEGEIIGLKVNVRKTKITRFERQRTQ